MTMWDVENGRLLRNMTDCHTPNAGCLSVRFSADPTLAFWGDSGGSIYSLHFRRVMGVRTWQPNVLFSGR